jgi:hypothetical protein
MLTCFFVGDGKFITANFGSFCPETRFRSVGFAFSVALRLGERGKVEESFATRAIRYVSIEAMVRIVFVLMKRKNRISAVGSLRLDRD